MSDLTEAEREALHRVKNTQVELRAVELRHPTWPSGPIRLIDYDLDVDLTLEADAPANAGETVTFTGAGFLLDDPGVDPDPDNTARLDVDGIPGFVQPYIAAAVKTDQSVEATIRWLLFDVSTNSIVDQSLVYHLQFRDANNTALQSSLTFGYTNSANQAFPSERYTPDSNPGLQ